MIDIGGPSMLRGAAKNFAHVAPVCRPEQYGFVLDELRAHGDALARDAARARRRGVRDDGRVRGGDRGLVRRARGVPRAAHVSLREGARPLLRREPAPARRVLRGARRAAHLLSRVEQLHGKELSYNNLNDLSAARLLAREFALPGVRDRQAREPVRRRGRARRSRRPTSARSRPTRSPRTAASSSLNRPVDDALGAALAEQFVEVLFAPGYDDGSARGAARRSRTRASSSTASAGAATPGERDYKRVLGGLLVQDRDAEIEDRERMDGRLRHAPTRTQWGDLLFALARLQARRLERDRARQGPADDRHRRRPDEPRRRGADRGREGARARPRPRRRGARVATRSSRSRTGRSSRSTRASTRDHPAGRLEARRRGDRRRRGRRARRWSSPAAGTSGTSASLATSVPDTLPAVAAGVPDAPRPDRARRRSSGSRRSSPRRSARTLLAKLEYLNPGGSIKDRIGLRDDRGRRARRAAAAGRHDRRADLRQHRRRPRDGARRSRATAASSSCPTRCRQEKIALLRAYGAEVVITPTAVDPDSPESYYSVSDRLAEEIPGGFKPDQYSNLANPEAHYQTTGPEIWEQTGGEIDAVVDLGRHRRHDHRRRPLPQGAEAGGADRRRRPGGLGLLGGRRRPAPVPRRGHRQGHVAEDDRPVGRGRVGPRLRPRLVPD